MKMKPILTDAAVVEAEGLLVRRAAAAGSGCNIRKEI